MDIRYSAINSRLQIDVVRTGKSMTFIKSKSCVLEYLYYVTAQIDVYQMFFNYSLTQN